MAKTCLFINRFIPSVTWCWGMIHLSPRKKETGLSELTREKLRNLYLTAEYAKYCRTGLSSLALARAFIVHYRSPLS